MSNAGLRAIGCWVALGACHGKTSHVLPDAGRDAASQSVAADGGAGGGGIPAPGTGGTTYVYTTGGAGGGSHVTTTATTCPWPARPDHGSVNAQSVRHGAIATYTCQPGFALSGAATRTCQDDNTWTDTDPTCLAVGVDCGPPPRVSNGVVSALSTLYNATATYYCSAGFDLEGSPMLTCQADGSWGTPPVCVCQTTCAGVCVDVQSDTNHCGRCENACLAPNPPSTVECMLGRCVVTLATSQYWTWTREMILDGTAAYWSDRSTSNTMSYPTFLNRVSLDGGPSQTLWSEQTTGIGALALQGSSLYFVTAEGIISLPLAGGAPVILAPPTYVDSLVADATNLYWISEHDVMKMPLVGGEPVTLASSLGSPRSLTLDATHLYWANVGTLDTSKPSADGSIMMLPMSGGVPTTLASAQDDPRNIVVDRSSVYWGTSTAIMKVALPGGTPTILVSGAERPCLAVDDAHVYWTNALSSTSGGSVWKVPREGGTPTKLAVAQSYPGTIAVDATSVYWLTTETVMKLYPK